MINSITAEHGNLAVLTAATAAFHSRTPLVPSPLPIVKPDPDLIRGIGRTLDRDAAHRSSPDIQSLLDGLLSNFGTEQDLPEANDARPDVSSEIRDNNEGSREAIQSLQQTANKGEETSSVLSEEVDSSDQNSKNTPKNQGKLIQNERAQSEASHNMSDAESDLSQAESLSERAAEATAQANELRAHSQDSRGLGTQESERLSLSVQLFDQKAAAAESAARLRKVMARKVLAEATSRVEKGRELNQKDTQEALRRLEGDHGFFERLQEMQRILQSR